MSGEVMSPFTEQDRAEWEKAHQRWKLAHAKWEKEWMEAHTKDESASRESAYHPVFESQVGGDHYKKLGVYQPWIVSSKWMTPEELKGAMKHTVFSYLAREKDKGGRSDIEKAHHTIGIYLELTKAVAE